MTPDRIGLPPPPSSTTPAPEQEDELRARTGRSIAVVVVLVLLITVLHFFTGITESNAALHLLYRRMYFIPIVYAAFVFGRRGGALTALACSVPFAIHAHSSLNHLSQSSTFDNWLEIATYFAVGLLFGTLRDLEEAKARDLRQVSLQLEEAYSKLEERAIQLINVQDYTSSILRSITSGVLTVGPDGSVATANPAAERMLEMSEFEMVPKAISNLFRDDGGISGDVTKVLSGRLPLALRETTLVTPAGREVHVQSSISRMRAVGGSILGAVVTLEDVSDIRALTDQLIRADRLAAMGELTAGVAHEVRNPLGVIRASVQLLEDAHCDQARIHEAASVIKQEIDRLDRVIKALLDFGRPSKPTLVRTDVNEVLEDVVLFTTRFATQADVKIRVEQTTDIPTVVADPDQLKQVFLNLVTNAVQAMDHLGGEIVIRTFSDVDYVVLEFRDTGPGIADEDLPKVFDPFFTKRSGGTGLGLTIVHRIIDEHDGHIEVTSSPEGTTFTVSLPAAIDG